MAEFAAAAWAVAKASAAYVAGSFKAVAAGSATAAQIATYVGVTVGGSMALTAVAGALMKPNVGGRAPGEWIADPNAGIPFAIGARIGAGGNIVYKNTFGKDNEYKGVVTVLSGAGPIGGFLGFTADREPVTFAGEAATGRWAGEMWMQRRLGNQPETALSSPAAISGHTLPGWGPAYALSGKAAFLWTLRMDSKFSTFPQGEPPPVTVMQGIRGYDHRLDSTMPGGMGPVRWGDRSTWPVITNPIIADLNWCLGLRENGKVVGGLGVRPEGIDWAAYTQAANVADANAWTVAAYPRSDEPKSEVRAAFLQAGGAVISRRAGLVSCVTRGVAMAPVMTISAADTAGPIELDTAANVLSRLNTLTPRYLSEAHEWQIVPADPVSAPEYVAEDRGRVRSDARDYPYVPSAKQAAELAALDLANSREGIAGRWPLKPYCRDIRPGEVFAVTEPELLLDGMEMLCLQREYDPGSDTVWVTFVSETPGKVAWALGQTPHPPPTPALAARPDLKAPDPDAWEVVIRPPTEAGGLPIFDIVIEIDNARAQYLVVELGPSAEGPWTLAQSVTVQDGRVTIGGLDPDALYWVALSYRSDDDGASPRSIKGPYRAGKLIASDLAPENSIFGDLNALYEEVLKTANDRVLAGLNRRDDTKARMDDTRDRLALLGKIDPVARTAIIRADTQFEGEGVASAETLTLLRAADEANEALVGLEELARIAGDEAEALARISAIGDVEDSIAATDLELRGWATDEIASATADLATLGQVGDAVGAAVLAMEGYADDAVAEGTADLVTQATFNGLSSTVGLQATAISGLEAQNNLARLVLIAAAGGGKPAMIGLASNSLGSAIALAAEEIWFGDNTTFDDASDTLRTTTGSTRWVQAWGAPFGSDNLISWRGPSSVTPGAETKANAGTAGAWEDANGDSYNGGRTLAGPFGDSVPTASIVLSSGWTTVATHAGKVVRNGICMFLADWGVTLTPSGVDLPAVHWRLALASGHEIASGVLTGVSGPQGMSTIQRGSITGTGSQDIVLQLALDAPTTAAATVTSAAFDGLYAPDATWP